MKKLFAILAMPLVAVAAVTISNPPNATLYKSGVQNGTYANSDACTAAALSDAAASTAVI